MSDRISSIASPRQGLDATRTSPPPVAGRKMSLDIPFHRTSNRGGRFGHPLCESLFVRVDGGERTRRAPLLTEMRRLRHFLPPNQEIERDSHDDYQNSTDQNQAMRHTIPRGNATQGAFDGQYHLKNCSPAGGIVVELCAFHSLHRTSHCRTRESSSLRGQVEQRL
jgi:hypothetical protein